MNRGEKCSVRSREEKTADRSPSWLLLWTAIAGSVAMQVLVVYVPFLQNAFGTTSLNVSDWILCIAVASSVLWLREGSKAVVRWKGPHV